MTESMHLRMAFQGLIKLFPISASGTSNTKFICATTRHFPIKVKNTIFGRSTVLKTVQQSMQMICYYIVLMLHGSYSFLGSTVLSSTTMLNTLLYS